MSRFFFILKKEKCLMRDTTSTTIQVENSCIRTAQCVFKYKQSAKHLTFVQYQIINLVEDH